MALKIEFASSPHPCANGHRFYNMGEAAIPSAGEAHFYAICTSCGTGVHHWDAVGAPIYLVSDPPKKENNNAGFA